MGPDRFPAAVELLDREAASRFGPPRPVPALPIPVPSLPLPRPVPSLDVAPVGMAPVARAPVGVAPVARAPVGVAPVARAPVGVAPRRRPGKWLVEWLAVVAVALVLAVGLRAYVLQLFYIPSGSMLPTLQVGDRIVVDKLAYRFEPIRRGDVVVFSHPPLEHGDYQDLVKRVIGLPGETLSLAGGHVYVDGRLLEEPWLPNPAPPSTPSPVDAAFSLAHPFTVPAGEYFVMGDDRTDSEDSRFFGPIPRHLVVGKMAFVAWPVSDDGWLVVLSVVAGALLVALLVVNWPRRVVPRHVAA